MSARRAAWHHAGARRRIGADRLRVNGIARGYCRTALAEAFYRDEAWREAMPAKTPRAHFGRLEDLVGASVLLV